MIPIKPYFDQKQSFTTRCCVNTTKKTQPVVKSLLLVIEYRAVGASKEIIILL